MPPNSADTPPGASGDAPGNPAVPPAGAPSAPPPSDTVAYPVVSSGLTRFSKPADAEPKIDTAKRTLVENLWKDALKENLQPTATIGSLATVAIQAAGPSLDGLQRVAPLPGTSTGAGAPVVVEDSRGKVVVQTGATGPATPAELTDSLAGGTIDGPAPENAASDAPAAGRAGVQPLDATGRPGGAPSSHAPTWISSQQPVTRGSQGTTRAGSSGPISSTAPTLPGPGMHDPSLGKIAPASRVLSPRPEDFRIEAKLASGGMGDVYVATQLGLQRVVALKRPKTAMRGSDHRINAFVREGTVTGDLEHPSIVPIYQNGVDADGLPYYAMKLVHGIEWRYLLHPDHAQERKDPEFTAAVAQKGAAMDMHEHLGVLLKVCDAVAFAHSRHILHRDLKPENVIVGDFGEVQVMDWGLAIDCRDNTPESSKALSRTNIKGPAGTPAYMAPEMALGEVAKISPATDVYLLGAILYEILTGRPPHGGSKLDRVLYQAAVNEIVPVKQANLEAAPGLIDIVNRALATEPGDRFATVQGFQQAIREHLTHEQSLKISIRAQNDLDKLLFNEPAAKPGSNASPTDDGGAKASARYVQFAELVAAFRQALALWPENPQARLGLRKGLVAFIEAALDGGDLGLAQAQLEPLRAVVAGEGAEGQTQVAALTTRWQALDQARRARQRNFRLAVRSVAVLSVVLVLGGLWSYINIRSERDIAETERGKAEQNFNEAERQRLLAQQQTTEAEKQRGLAEHARIDADQQRKSAEQNADLARQNEAAAVAEKKEADRQRSIAETQQKEAIAQKTEAEKQRAIADQERGVAETQRAEAVRQGKRAEDNFQEAERQRIEAVTNLGRVDIQRAMSLLAFSKDYPQAAVYLLRAVDNMRSANPARAVRELELVFQSSPRRLAVLPVESGARGLAFPGVSLGSLLILRDDGKVVHADDPGPDLGAPTGLHARCMARWNKDWVVVDAEGALRTGGSEGQVIERESLQKTRARVLAVNATGLRLAVGCKDGRVVLLESGDEPGTDVVLNAHHGAVTGLAFRAGGRELVTTGTDGRLCVWELSGLKDGPAGKDSENGKDPNGRKPLREIRAFPGFIAALAVDASGMTAATASAEGPIKLWNLTDLSERAALTGHQREVGALAFNPNRPVLASQGWDGTVRLWNVASEVAGPPCQATLHVDNPSPSLGVAFSADGMNLACLAGDSVQLWDLTNRVDNTSEAWLKANVGAALPFGAADGFVQFRSDRGLPELSPDGKVELLPATGLFDAFMATDEPKAPGRYVLSIGIAGEFGMPGRMIKLPHPEKGPVLCAAHTMDRVAIYRAGLLQVAEGNLAIKPTFASIDAPAGLAGIALAPSGRMLAWKEDGALVTADLKDEPDEIAFHTGHRKFAGKILQAVWLPGENSVLLRTTSVNLTAVDQAGNPVGAITGHRSAIRAIAVDNTGQWLASVDAGGQVRLADLTDLSSRPFGPTLPGPADGMVFDIEGKHLIIHLENGTIKRFVLPQVPENIDSYVLRQRIENDLGIDTGEPAAPTGDNPLTPSPVPDVKPVEPANP